MYITSEPLIRDIACTAQNVVQGLERQICFDEYIAMPSFGANVILRFRYTGTAPRKSGIAQRHGNKNAQSGGRPLSCEPGWSSIQGLWAHIRPSSRHAESHPRPRGWPDSPLPLPRGWVGKRPTTHLPPVSASIQHPSVGNPGKWEPPPCAGAERA